MASYSSCAAKLVLFAAVVAAMAALPADCSPRGVAEGPEGATPVDPFTQLRQCVSSCSLSIASCMVGCARAPGRMDPACFVRCQYTSLRCLGGCVGIHSDAGSGV